MFASVLPACKLNSGSLGSVVARLNLPAVIFMTSSSSLRLLLNETMDSEWQLNVFDVILSVFQPLLININPKTTSADGTCGNTTATLKLNDGNSTLISFTFVVVSNFFHFKLSCHFNSIA